MMQPAHVKREPQLHDTDEADLFDIADAVGDAASDARAEADIAASRVVSNEAVIRWLTSLATSEPLPRPECGE